MHLRGNFVELDANILGVNPGDQSLAHRSGGGLCHRRNQDLPHLQGFLEPLGGRPGRVISRGRRQSGGGVQAQIRLREEGSYLLGIGVSHRAVGRSNFPRSGHAGQIPVHHTRVCAQQGLQRKGKDALALVEGREGLARAHLFRHLFGFFRSKDPAQHLHPVRHF